MSLAGYSPWGLKRIGHDLATKQHNLISLPTTNLNAQILTEYITLAEYY